MRICTFSLCIFSHVNSFIDTFIYSRYSYMHTYALYTHVCCIAYMSVYVCTHIAMLTPLGEPKVLCGMLPASPNRCKLSSRCWRLPCRRRRQPAPMSCPGRIPPGLPGFPWVRFRINDNGNMKKNGSNNTDDINTQC